jgi:hypothetical protein
MSFSARSQLTNGQNAPGYNYEALALALAREAGQSSGSKYYKQLQQRSHVVRRSHDNASLL